MCCKKNAIELLLGHLEQMMEWKVKIEVQVQLRINALSGRAVGLYSGSD